MGKDAPDSIARLCRQYIAFLESPTEDSLFNWSNALHSMHDRVPGTMRDELFKSGEFIAMKALRNHFHHGGEVAHRIRVLSIEGLPITCDLPVLCLIDRSAAETAIKSIDVKFKVTQQPLAERALKWYGQFVNLNPAIFNLMVQIVQQARQHGLEPNDDAYLRLLASIEEDKANGHPVTVTGDILCPAGSVDQVLASVAST